MEKEFSNKLIIPLINPTNLQSLNTVFWVLDRLSKYLQENKIKSKLINNLLKFTYHSSVWWMPLSLKIKNNFQNELFYALTDEIYGKWETVTSSSPIYYGMYSKWLRLFKKLDNQDCYLLDVIFDRERWQFTNNELNLYKYIWKQTNIITWETYNLNEYCNIMHIWLRDDWNIVFISNRVSVDDHQQIIHNDDVNYWNLLDNTIFTPRQDSIESVEIINKILQQIKY